MNQQKELISEEIEREFINNSNNDIENNSQNLIDYKRICQRFDLIDCLWMFSGCYIFKKSNK